MGTVPEALRFAVSPRLLARAEAHFIFPEAPAYGLFPAFPEAPTDLWESAVPRRFPSVLAEAAVIV
jgi:hypothetical protein